MAWRHTASVTITPLVTIPGGNPVTVAVGQLPMFPLTPVGPVLVTPEPANTAKLSVVPRLTGASSASVAVVRTSAKTPRTSPTTSSGPSLDPMLCRLIEALAARL